MRKRSSIVGEFARGVGTPTNSTLQLNACVTALVIAARAAGAFGILTAPGVGPRVTREPRLCDADCGDGVKR